MNRGDGNETFDHLFAGIALSGISCFIYCRALQQRSRICGRTGSVVFRNVRFVFSTLFARRERGKIVCQEKLLKYKRLARGGKPFIFDVETFLVYNKLKDNLILHK